MLQNSGFLRRRLSMGEEYDMLGEKGERDMKEYRSQFRRRITQSACTNILASERSAKAMKNTSWFVNYETLIVDSWVEYKDRKQA